MEAEKPIVKFLHIPLLVISNTVSIVLLCLLNRRFTGSFPYRVTHHRDVTAVIVQIAATLLTTAQIYVLCTLINFAARLHSTQKFIRVSSLKFLAALSVPRIDWSLKWYATIITATFLLFGPLLGAVWAGALTPLVANSLRGDGTIQIPQYSGSFDTGWSLQPGGSISLNCGAIQWTPSILIRACPAIDYITNLLATAQSATPLQDVLRVYPKIAVPTWSYENRSYGVGASQGLFTPTVNLNHSYTTYTYDEPGYLSQVTCGYNATSNLTVSPLGAIADDPLVLWQVNGSLPNTVATDTSSYTLTTANTNWYDEVLGWSAAAANGRNILAIATYTGFSNSDHWYESWNNMQCSIDFQPTLFSVFVNLNQSRIVVTPKSPYADFESTGSLKKVTMANLDLISRMSSNIGVSTLGVALNTNSAAVGVNYPNITLNDTLARGAENMIAALVDDLLMTEASKQMTINNGIHAAQVTKQFDAVRLGSPTFIYISLGVNIALVLLVLAEILRTKAWQHLPAFDFTNLLSVMAAAMLSSPSPTSHHDDDDASSHSDSGKIGGHYADAAVVARKLKHASVKWTSSHDDDDSVVMLVNLPGGEESGLSGDSSSVRPVATAGTRTSGDGTSAQDIELHARSPEHQVPLLGTPDRSALSPGS